jgi:hypothetical protein
MMQVGGVQYKGVCNHLAEICTIKQTSSWSITCWGTNSMLWDALTGGRLEYDAVIIAVCMLIQGPLALF